MKRNPDYWLRMARQGLEVLAAWPSHAAGRTWTHPISVNFLVTTRCNSRCVTCDSWKLGSHDRELSLEDYRRLASEAADLGVYLATLGGGEPTLRQDLCEIIRALKAAGLCVQLTTNGLTLHEPLRRRLYEIGLDRLTVSIDSHLPEVYGRIRGLDGAARALGNVRALLAERPASLEVETNSVLCVENAATFLDTIDQLIAWGVPRLSFSAATVAGENYLFTGDKPALARMDAALVARLVAGLLDRRRRHPAITPSRRFILGLPAYLADPTRVVYPCFAGYLTIDVFADGSVHGCGNLPPLGNVRQADLRTIWRSPAAQANRVAMAKGQCPSCYLSCKAELAIIANPRYLVASAVDRMRAL